MYTPPGIEERRSCIISYISPSSPINLLDHAKKNIYKQASRDILRNKVIATFFLWFYKSHFMDHIEIILLKILISTLIHWEREIFET